MPKGLPALSEGKIRGIFDWIASGAPAAELAGSAPVLSGTSPSSTQINLLWIDNTSNESGFRIERAFNAGGPFTQIFEATAGAVNFSDTNLSPATAYFYRVYAFNSLNISDPSNVISVTTQASPTTIPAAPSALAASLVSSTSVTLTWQDNSNNESVFKIERSVTGGGYAEIAQVNVGVTTYQNINLTPATSYSYRVRASNAAGNSTYSNSLTITTLSALTDTFASLNANIFTPKCVSCHSGNGAKGGYKMSSYNEVKTRVVASDSNPGSTKARRTINFSLHTEEIRRIEQR